MSVIRILNEETVPHWKSYHVCKNFEDAVVRMAAESRLDLQTRFRIKEHFGDANYTQYVSRGRIISIGLTAHERLAGANRSSLLYLDPGNDRVADDVDLRRIAQCTGRGQAASNVVLLGNRANRLGPYLPKKTTRRCDLPPVDFYDQSGQDSDPRRLTIVNHLADDSLARHIVHRFLGASDFLIDCIGTRCDRHNRVRGLTDAEVGEEVPSLHIHVGLPARGTDRLRLSDSWQSRVPVLLFDVLEAGTEGGPLDQGRNEHDVLLCKTYDDACTFLALLLDSPNLRRSLVANGRASAAPAARRWAEIARDLAA